MSLIQVVGHYRMECFSSQPTERVPGGKWEEAKGCLSRGKIEQKISSFLGSFVFIDVKSLLVHPEMLSSFFKISSFEP